MTTAGNYEVEQALQDFVDRRSKGQSPSITEYLRRHPNVADTLLKKFEVLEALDRAVTESGSTPPDATVLGDFRIHEELGRGGMGVVFLAEQLSEKRLVALKLLGSPTSQRYGVVERFRREAEIASRLRHPNLVSVYGVGERHGYVFYSMQYVEGVPLDRLLTRIHEKGGLEQLGTIDVERLVAELIDAEPTPSSERPANEPGKEKEETKAGRAQRSLGYYGIVAQIVSELADGLAFAHSRGIIHRDVKPSNILLSNDLVPQLADFGVAREVDQRTITKAGDVIGTPHYMSPEMAMAGRLPIDYRTDIFSLGVTLFEFLTLALPFSGKTSAEVLNKIAFEPTPLPSRFNPSVPQDLQTIAYKALEKDPSHRYATASEMAEDLRRFLRFDPIKARMPGKITFALRRLRRRWRIVAIGAGFLASLGVLSFTVQSAAMQREWLARIADADFLESRGTELNPRPWHSALEIHKRVDFDSDGRVAESRTAIPRLTKAVTEAAADLEQEASRLLSQKEVSDEDRSRAIALLAAAEDVSEPAAPGGIRKLLDKAYGIQRLSITSEPSDATVTIQRISSLNGELGERLEVGVTPLVNVERPAGRYWVVVAKPDFGYGEYFLDVNRGESAAALHARLRATAEVTVGMIEVPAGTYRIGITPEGRARFDEHIEREVTEAGFFIDRTEVSNEEFARFVRETGHPPPPHWREPGNTFRPEVATFPVTNVTWTSARLYAEWAGKRLPTEVEWEIACRGQDGRLYPWGNEFVEANAGRPITAQDRLRFDPDAWLESVDSRPEGQSPFGAFHMADNAAEWVNDLWRGAVDGTPNPELLPVVGQRVIRGNWLNMPEGQRCLPTVRGAFPPEAYAGHIGFRCAKSHRP